MVAGTKGMSEILSKVRVPKRTKEATAMNEAYEPTQTAIQYWQAVEAELKARKEGYEKVMADYRTKGGQANGVGDNMVLQIHGTQVTVLMNHDGRAMAIDTHLPIDAPEEDLKVIANAVTAIIGLSKNEDAQAMVKELRAYVENDGYLTGMNALVNKTVLQNPVLTALTMVPDDPKGKKDES